MTAPPSTTSTSEPDRQAAPPASGARASPLEYERPGGGPSRLAKLTGLALFVWDRRRTWLPAAISAVITAAVCLAFVVVRQYGGLEPVELWTYDRFLNWRPADESPSQVVVVGVTEEDITSERRGLGKVVSYPVLDSELQRILEKLLEYKPRAIGIDIYRDIPVPGVDDVKKPASVAGADDAEKPESAPGAGAAAGVIPQWRKDLIQFFNDHDNVYTIMRWASSDYLVQPPDGVKAKQVGFVDHPEDEGNIVRRGLLTFKDPRDPTGRKTFTSLGGRLALRYLAEENPPIRPAPNADGDAVLGKGVIRWFEPNDGGYVDEPAGANQFLLDFRRRRGFDVVRVARVLGVGGAEPLRPEDIAGKVVLIGVTAPSVKDLVDTPVYRKTERAEEPLYGVETHAMIIDQLLRTALRGEDWTRVWPDRKEVSWIIVCGLFGGALGFLVREPPAFWPLLAAGAGLIFAIAWDLFRSGLWVPALSPMFNWVACAALVTMYMGYQERADRAVLNKLFEMHVSEKVVQTVWANRDQFIREGHMRPSKVTATVMFTDLQGFTTISEKLGTEIIGWLNEYMSEMSAVVDEHGGFVNKYIGDAVMAVWGPPLPRTADEQRQDAVNAVACAVRMRHKLNELNERWGGQGFGGLCMRVGILTGEVVAGSLGSADRLEYTVIGPVVNTASRLESYDKDLMDDDITGNGVCRILIGQPTLECLGDRFEVRRIGDVELKGVGQPVAVYGVVRDRQAAPGA
jgi:adenylate cyclase